MLKLIGRRLIGAVPVLFIVSALTYAGLELVPGDPILAILGDPTTAVSSPTEEDIAELKAEYGLDQPLLIRYGHYLGRLAQGDLGRSIISRRPVTESIQQGLSVSLWLNAVTLVVSISVGVALGTVAGLRPGGFVDLLATFIAVAGIAAPGFWVAIFLIIIFAVNLGWLPASGWTDPLEDPGGAVKRMIMPVAALGFAGTAAIMRQTRSGLLEVMRQDYITTARAKGLSARVVTLRHAMRNAMLPVVTLLGFQISTLVAGSVLIESVFAIPGVGRLAVDATRNADYPLLQAIVLMFTLAALAGNLFADVTYAWLDPRIRYQ